MPSADRVSSVGQSHLSRALRRDIQGLRAVAVLAVIANHLVHWPVGGFVGVDIFFVISGFLITSHILRELEQKGKLSFGGFYRRRARRILPAATVVLAVTVIGSAFLLTRDRAASAALDALWAFFFGANWRALIVETDYFQLGLPPSPLQHYWSLSIEEQFYFVWPLFAVLLFSLAAWRQVRRRQTPAWVIVAAGFGVLTLISFIWSLIETSTAPSSAYFSTFSRAWELGAGAVLAAVAPHIFREARRALRLVVAVAGVALIIASVLFITPELAFPGPAAALPVFGTILVIAAGTNNTDANYDPWLFPLTNRVSQYIGSISYSLYLWHFPVIVLLATIFPVDSKKYIVFALALMTVLSLLSYHFIEEPARRSRWLQPRQREATELRSHSSKLTAIAVSVALVFGLGIAVGRLTTPQPAPLAAAPSTGECFGAAASPGAGNDCSEVDPDAALVPSLDQLSSDTGGGYACWRPKGGELKSCTYGSEAPDALRVAVVGDSHAAALLPALLTNAEERNWALTTYVGFGCQWREPLEGSDCDSVMNEIVASLANPEDPFDVIITTAARWANDDVDSTTHDSAAAWNTVSDLGTKVIVVADAPSVSEDALSCLARIGVDPTECSTSREVAMAPADPLIEASAIAKDAHLVDLTDYFCNAKVCPATFGGVIVYRDTAGHISASYMKSLAPYVIAQIDAIVG